MKFNLPKLSSLRGIFKKKTDAASSGSAASVTSYDRDYHKLTLDELCAKFSTSATDGIDQSAAQQLLIKNGKNKIKQKRKNPILKILGYFVSGFCVIIWLAAIVCILAWKPIGDPPDPTNLGLGIMLMVVIFIQAGFTAFQDWSSGRVMKSIKNMMPSEASVIRNGVEKKIPVEELVVGDLVVLNYGQKVPADIRLTEVNDIKFDKSMLTGESDAIEGSIECTDERYVESKNIAYMTTLITNGQGKGIVIETGHKTMMGSIASLTSQTHEKKTTLQLELRRFVMIVATAAVIMAIIVVIVWATWLRTQYPSYINIPALLVNTISVMVAFIPEGLPVCVTLSLLLIAKRMAKSRVLVKNLSTIETLSCVNVIASDKTGTLTQNKMFVANAAVGLDGVNLEEFRENESARSIGFNQLVACSSLCNNASFDETDKNATINNRKANGDATDIALLRFSTLYQKYPNISQYYQVLSEIPFNSKNKWMMKIVRPINSSSEKFKKNKRSNSIISSSSMSQIAIDAHKTIFRNETEDLMLLKGAPDYLLKKCRRILDENGDEKQLTNQHITDLIKLQNDWCILGQRVLLICKRSIDYAHLESSSSSWSTSDVESLVHKTNDFCIVGLVGIIDPPRENIAEVVAKCKGAGIRVFMVTGDYALTAAAIALQIGIFTATQYDTAEVMRIKHKENHESYEKSALLLTGSDLESFTSEDWRLVTPYEEIVFARTTPEQKLRTVKEFQQDGYIVGVTGDGVNDAPALKSADIGIAMGGGSEVAMEAAQLVLLDNNFSSILVAIKNGRLVFANLKKVILYLIPGGCFAELIPVLMSIFLGVTQNISSFQMLIISLFTDIAPSLSLIMEKPEKDLLKQPPRSKKDHLVDWKFLLQAYGILGSMIVLFSQCMFFWYMNWYAGLSPDKILLSFGSLVADDKIKEHFYTGQTVTFMSIVYLQIFGNLLSTRTNFKSFFVQSPWKKSTRNLYLFGAQLISMIILILVVFIPPLNSIFNTRPPPPQFFFMPLAFCVILFSVDELRKLLVRRKKFKFHKFAW